MAMTDQQWTEWCQTFGVEAPPIPTGQPVTINIFIDNSVNVQHIGAGAPAGARLVDTRQRVIPARALSSMEQLQAAYDADPDYFKRPVTKEEKAQLQAIGWYHE